MAKGRPREFDCEQALDKALEVFWRHGYEGASLPALTKAMGINRPSLYAAFGNKESLFKKVVDRYTAAGDSRLQSALAAPTARQAVETLLYGSADLLSDPSHPRGCMVVQTAQSCGESSESIKQGLAARRAAVENALRVRFDQAVQTGDLPNQTNPADLARYIAAVSHGMSVLASGGATRDELRHVVDMAMRAWPGK